MDFSKKSRYWTVRTKSYSYLISKKTLAVTAVLLAVTAAVFLLSTGTGSVFLSPVKVVKAIIGTGDPMSETIVRSLRLPRTLIAVLVGAALAVSGAVLQGMVRNSLASPDSLGMTGGATLGAILYFFLLAGSLGIHWLPLCAVLGAFAAAVFVYGFSWRRGGGVTPLRLVLIGTAFTQAANALSYMLMISGPIILANLSLTFMTGSIYGVSWQKHVLPLLPWLIVLLPATLLYARHVNIQELGEDVARSVGGRVQRQRLVLLLLAVSLAGAGVAIGGAVGFIGLMAPHMARRLVGPAFGGVLPVSALLGSLILLVADLGARTLFSPLDIPAGVFTAAVGAPFFIYLVYRSRGQ
ncbi:iron ABC transporter permease [Paenibacillus aurantius]|uniref:Iron ABC transporter permease n=1 Tax=Paenibacillus aurantius TaxID=2918900 RepID=A0AA96RFE7_9BACL|nr:iron ABC transporter permease [Paenibacillus aurantius]WNQ11907.1 iron ABC transporter permease [Paenibacillus aurantius]